MDINDWPKIFARDEFGFKHLKAHLPASEIATIKSAYQAVWQAWKAANLAAATQVALPAPKIESWTNGWKLRDHFWCAYRDGATNPCIGVLLNRTQLQVYLMYQHYKNETRTGSVTTYQRLLAAALPRWQESIDPTHFAAWRETAPEHDAHPTLAQAPALDPTGPLMVGRVWRFPLEVDFAFTQAVPQAIAALLPLYQAVTKPA